MDALTARLMLRWMIRRDMDQVTDIDRRSFAEPWDPVRFFTIGLQRSVICKVAEAGDRICGYLIYEMRKGRFDLLRLAVDPELHRQGVGTLLLRHLQGRLGFGGRRAITTLVEETNLFGQLFLRSLGFRAVHTFPGCYDGRDGYMFEYRLPGVTEDVFD